MYTQKAKMVTVIIGTLFVIGGILFQASQISKLQEEIDESKEDIQKLEKEQIINTDQNKALSEELEVLESDYRESLEEIETFEESIIEKDNQIDKLEKDLISKKEREAEEARLAKAEKAKVVGPNDDKSGVSSKKNVKTASSSSSANTSGTNLGTFEATAYGADCVGCSGVTANGTDIRNGNIYVDGYRVIASDPSVIPMNSIVKITYSSGKTEMAKVSDVGGAIKGKIIDIAFATEAETVSFGRQKVQIELIK